MPSAALDRFVERVVVSWSGGKDASLALQRTLADLTREVGARLRTVNAADGRISMHGVPAALLECQTAALDRPLRTVPLPPDASQVTYAARLAEAMAEYEARGIDRRVFADSFLAFGPPGPSGWPARRSRAPGHCGGLCERRRPRAGLAGRPLDHSFFGALPDGVDPCGEHGEFHTFVTDGPWFDRPVPVAGQGTVSKPVGDGTYHYADLVPDCARAPLVGWPPSENLYDRPSTDRLWAR